MKYFPSQIHTQAPISIALELRDRVKLDEVESINLETYKRAWRSAGSEPEKWDPQTRETADHSLPYLISVAFRDGAVTPSSFTPDRVRDPDLRPLMQKISIKENPDFTRHYPEAQMSKIEVVTKSGDRIVERTSYPKGHRKNPLTDEELEDKFRSLSETSLTPQQSRRAMDVLWKLDDLDNIDPVFDSFQVQRLK